MIVSPKPMLPVAAPSIDDDSQNARARSMSLFTDLSSTLHEMGGESGCPNTTQPTDSVAASPPSGLNRPVVRLVYLLVAWAVS